jgi:hypothetical protein
MAERRGFLIASDHLLMQMAQAVCGGSGFLDSGIS